MARFHAIISALLILASACGAATHELTAHILNPTTSSFDISNCGQNAGPSRVSFTVFIENALDQYMAVEYEVFNNNTQSWEYAGKLCNIPANQIMHCSGTMNLYLGGKGNGTFTADLLRLTGRSEATPGDVYTKTFSFTVRHYAGEREQNLVSHKESLEAALGEVRSLCASNPSCCTQHDRDAVDEAESLLAESNRSLSACDLPTLYSKLVSAESLLDGVVTDVNTCLESQPTPTPSAAPTSTPHATPSAAPSESPTPSPSPTQTASPSPSQTPQPSPNSVCPIGLGLAVLCGFAALERGSHKK